MHLPLLSHSRGRQSRKNQAEHYLETVRQVCGFSNYFSVLEHYSERLDFLIVILFQFYKQQLQTEKKNNRKNDKSVASPSKKISLIQEKTPPAMIRKLTSLSWFWLYFQILYVIAFFLM